MNNNMKYSKLLHNGLNFLVEDFNIGMKNKGFIYGEDYFHTVRDKGGWITGHVKNKKIAKTYDDLWQGFSEAFIFVAKRLKHRTKWEPYGQAW